MARREERAGAPIDLKLRRAPLLRDKPA